MKRNMGTTDRVVRVVIAFLIAGFYLGGAISGTLAVILGIIAVVFLLTSAMGFCLLYLPLNITTCKKG
jgi:hypothetical protein